jgi:F-type H+-transporting ATPase subunit b
MPILALASGLSRAATEFQAAEPATFTINLFWVIVAAVNFIVFLGLIYAIFFRPVSSLLESRRERIEQGLRDADAARVEREQAATERLAVLTAARQEANDLLARAQKQADDNREREIADTRAEIERLRDRATADIESERQRALADVRSQVADLALLAAGRLVGETMTESRERRLVDEFLTRMPTREGGAANAENN